MAVPASSKVNCFTCFNFIFLAICGSNINSANAQSLPGQSLAKAFFCFNNKFIYTGCDEAYRLNESGNLNIPPDATDIFCNGACLAETQLVLKCVDNVFSGFIFYNRATIRDVTNVLHSGCSYTSRRGNFDVGDYFRGEINEAPRFGNFKISLTTLALIIWFYVAN